MGLIRILGAFLMAGLFAIAILSYAINFGEDNNTNITLGDDSRFTSVKTNLESNVQNFKSQSGKSSAAFQNSTTEAGSDSVKTGGFIKTITAPYNTVKTIFGLKNVIIGNKDGTDEFGIIFNGLIGFFVIVTMFLMWKAWRGNPE